ncbi:MAG TPA: acyltransferase [Actinomycetota bacterium]
MVRSALSSDLRDLGPVRLAAIRGLSAAVVGAYRVALGDRFDAGEGVVANHRLLIKGPGRIRIADRANLFTFGVGRRLRLITRSPRAVIDIGENAQLNGTDVQAEERIEIGPDCMVGQAHLLDTDMHSLAFDRRTNRDAPVRVAPIVLERNVWVGRGAAILPGVRVGENSVIAYGSVVTADVPPCVVVAGNPARVVRTLP